MRCMTYLEALRAGTERLQPTCVDAERESLLILGAVTGAPQSTQWSDPDRPLSPAHAKQFADWLTRRANGEPFAYLTGRREFWSLPLHVTPDVLIPRPETELLVERALALHAANSAAVLDLGTGSGAIAIALAHERPQWRITATDTSVPALAVARDNARQLGLTNIELLLGDWFEAVHARKFALIVSNPPYIAADDAALNDRALLHEPRTALTPGSDGLIALHHLVDFAADFLNTDGWLILEHGAGQHSDVANRLVACGYAQVRSHRDLAGHTRVTEGRWPGASVSTNNLGHT